MDIPLKAEEIWWNININYFMKFKEYNIKRH